MNALVLPNQQPGGERDSHLTTFACTMKGWKSALKYRISCPIHGNSIYMGELPSHGEIGLSVFAAACAEYEIMCY
jgi:hypothetical protein